MSVRFEGLTLPGPLEPCPWCAPDEKCAICLAMDEMLTAAAWDETKHPRHPRGTEQGGEFAPKYTGETFVGQQGFQRGPGKVTIAGERPRLPVSEVFENAPAELEQAVTDWAHLREQDPGYETVRAQDLVPTQDQMSAVRVKEYVQELQQDNNLGELLDSVRVVEGDDGRLYIADGHNRVAAAMEMGNAELRLPVIRQDRPPLKVAGEFAAPRTAGRIEGFPQGEFTPEDSVAFWPQRMGSYSGFIEDAPHGPLWKSLYDPGSGEELAFWFADVNGLPHHDSMQRALGQVPSDRTWWPYSGYGTTGEQEWLDARNARTKGYTVGGKPNPRAVAIEQDIVRRHRRDIRDANAMLPENQAMAAAVVPPEDLTPEQFTDIVAEEAAKLGPYEEQLAKLYRRVIHKVGLAMAERFRKLAPTPLGLAAAGWEEAEHPRSPRGTREGGRWTTKLGRDVFVESKGGTVSVHQSTTPDRAFVTQYLPDIAQWPEHVPISVRLEYARLRSEALMRADQPGFDEVAAEARRLLDSIDGLVAAAPPADWHPPTVAELLAAAEEIDRATEAANKIQAASFEQIVEGVLARIGISFEVRAILVQAILNGLGARAVEMIEGIRVPVARAVANSYLNGLSVPQTAEAIMEAVDGLAEWQATQLARNDLVGIANGGSLTSARILKEKFPEVGLGYKEWLATDDERTRPTHNEAHGQRVPIETPFIVGGAPLAYPGDPTGPDQEVINCRCTLIYRAEPKTAVTAAGVWGLELTELTAAFDESKHPRDPKGTETGGQFARKETTTAKGAGRQIARHTLARIRQGLEGAVEMLKEAAGKPGVSNQVMGEVRVPGYQFWQSAASGQWTFTGYGPWDYRNYFDTPEEVVAAALADLDANAHEVEANFGKLMAGNVLTKRANPAMYEFLNAQREKNDASPRWKDLAERWGVGQTEVVLTAAAASARGKDDVSGFYEPSSGTVFLNGEELAWKMEPDAQGENKPGMFSAGTNVAGLLRHEHSHAIWDRMTKPQQAEFLAKVPQEKETLRQLTGYAAAAKEYYDSNGYVSEDSPWQGEVFAEAIAATTDPNYRPEDWPAWVNEMGEWVQKLPARKR